MSLCLREYILHLTMASRWLHDIVKPSHTIRINIVCKITTSCIVRDCIGYNRVSIVCPSVGFVHASAQATMAFYQIRDENRAKLKNSYSCGHRVSKSARYDATFKGSLSFSGVVIWNSIPLEIKQSSSLFLANDALSGSKVSYILITLPPPPIYAFYFSCYYMSHVTVFFFLLITLYPLLYLTIYCIK